MTLETRAGPIRVGTVLTHDVTYTAQDVSDYLRLIGRSTDEAAEELPYLLVIAPLTKLGGDLDYLSAGMEWDVLGPVRAGRPIRAEMEVTALGPEAPMTKIVFNARITVDGTTVVTGRSRGVLVRSARA